MIDFKVRRVSFSAVNCSCCASLSLTYLRHFMQTFQFAVCHLLTQKAEISILILSLHLLTALIPFQQYTRSSWPNWYQDPDSKCRRVHGPLNVGEFTFCKF